MIFFIHSFMILPSSNIRNDIFGLLISGISSYLIFLSFWIAILNLRSYYLIFKDYPSISLGFLDYHFHASINITNLIWSISFKIG